MLIFGHRGASGHEPENTIAAFEKAIELGADGVELDVHRIKSGELVVFHDNRVHRTTDGTGYVADYTLAGIQKLDAGDGQKIPTISEVLDAVDRRAIVNIELKGIGTAEPLADLLGNYIAAGWSVSDFIVSSFNHVELAQFHELQPDIPIGALIVGVLQDYAQFAEDLDAASVHPAADFVTQELVDDAHDRGLLVFVFTADDRDEVERMQSLGVDAIFTNHPDKVREYLQLVD